MPGRSLFYNCGMDLAEIFRKFKTCALLTVALFGTSSLFAAEVVRPVSLPASSVTFGGMAELRDDVYSLDARLSTEIAFCKCFSVFSDISYRFFSYQWETKLSNQLHEIVNLQVNGLNESYLGFKLFPTDYFGVSANFRFSPGDGDKNDRFERLAVEPMAVYPFSEYLNLGASLGYYTFLEKDNFEPGDEIGGRVSLEWKPFYALRVRRGLRISYVFLLRHRLEESRNLNMRKEFQKMDDAYWGFRMRGELSYSFAKLPVGIGAAYEMNRGTLFGLETGHRVEFFLQHAF